MAGFGWEFGFGFLGGEGALFDVFGWECLLWVLFSSLAIPSLLDRSIVWVSFSFVLEPLFYVCGWVCLESVWLGRSWWWDVVKSSAFSLLIVILPYPLFSSPLPRPFPFFPDLGVLLYILP